MWKVGEGSLIAYRGFSPIQTGLSGRKFDEFEGMNMRKETFILSY